MSETSGEESIEESTTGPSLSVPSWIVLVLVGLVPALFASGFSNYEALKEVAVVGGLGIALAWWGVLVWRRRSVAMASGRAVTLALLFGVYVLAATLWSPTPLAGLWEALQFAALAVAVLLVAAPVGRSLTFLDFAVAVGAGAAVSGAMGVLDLIGVGAFTVIWDPPGPTASFDAMEFAVAYYVVALPVLMAAIFRFSGRWKWFFVGAFLLGGFHFGLMAGWEMSAVFAGVCAVGALLMIAFERWRATAVLTPALILLGAIAVFVAIGQWGMEGPEPTSDATSLPHLQKPHLGDDDAHQTDQVRHIVYSPDRHESIASWDARAYLVDVAEDFFGEQPVVGHGAGAWWALQSKHINIDHPYVSSWYRWYPSFRSPHNGAAKLLVEYGLSGLILFALFVAAALGVVVVSIGAGGEPDEWMLEHWALLTSGLAGVVFMFFTPLIELAPAALLWMVALGFGLRLSAERLGFAGGTQRWSLGAPEGAGWLNRLAAVMAVAVVVGAGMLTVSVMVCGADVIRGHADHLMLRTSYRDAIEEYERIEEWYPADSDVPLNIAIAASRTGQHDLVDEATARAVEARPYDVRALERRGRVELGKGEKGEALRYARRAIEAFPNSLEARKLMIATRDMRGEYEKAVEAALELLEDDPPRSHRAQLHMTVGDLYAEMLDDREEARKHYEEALELIEVPGQRTRIKDKLERLEQSGTDEMPMPPGHEGHGH